MHISARDYLQLNLKVVLYCATVPEDHSTLLYLSQPAYAYISILISVRIELIFIFLVVHKEWVIEE